MLKKIILIPFITVVFLLSFQYKILNAAQIEVGDFTLNKEDIIEDDIYISGDKVIINGVVDGDLFVVGQDITVSGTITGDIYSFGSEITLEGNVYGNTILLGTDISVNGSVRENMYIAGVKTDLEGIFGKDISLITGALELKGSVQDDIRAYADEAKSEATVGGDMILISNQYSVDENLVSGDLIASNKGIFPYQEDKSFSFSKEDLLGFNIGITVVSFLGMYIVGILLILSAPVKTLQIEKRITSSWEEFLKSYAVGLVILFTIPIPLFLLALTLVGLPLASLIVAILIFLSIFGTIWAESAIGHKVLQILKKKDTGRFFSLLIGRGISVILRLIPIVKGLYSFSLVLVTVGAIVRTKYDAFKKIPSNKVKGKK